MAQNVVLSQASPRKAWALVKLYTAMKDLPEIIPLVALLGGTVVLAGTMTYRQYFTLAGDQFYTPELRSDMEKQVHYSNHHQDIKPSVLWQVAQWRKDKHDNTADTGIWPFHNKIWNFDHTPAHVANAKVASDLPYDQRGSVFPQEY